MNAPLGHIGIRASAGSGKTFQLTLRYLRLLLRGEKPSSILATTFTRKAAGEIAARVLGRLAKAATSDDETLALARELGEPDLDRKRTQKLLRTVIDDLPRLRIATLDGFFGSLFSLFSVELRVPATARIVGDEANAALVDEAIHEALEAEGRDGAVVLLRMLAGGQYARAVSERLANAVRDAYDIFLESDEGAWRSEHQPPLEDDVLARYLGDLETSAEPGRLREALAGVVADTRSGRFGAVIEKKLVANAYDDTPTYYREPLPNGVIDALRAVGSHARAVLLRRLGERTTATHRFLSRVDGALRRLRRERGAYRFDDITRALAEGTPDLTLEDVFYRLDGRISHLLLDEFQDTSLLQWRILRPFVTELTAHHDGTRSLFVVGDPKQAIYGFRGGVAEIFERAFDDARSLEMQPLAKSYRSAPVVIDAVNKVFSTLEGNSALSHFTVAAALFGGRFDRHETAVTAEGHVRLLVAEASDNAKKATIAKAAAVVAAIAEDPRRGTIGVLVRRNGTVPRMVRALAKEGVIASEEGGNPLTDAPVVAALLSLFLLADHPGDTAARFHVAETPLAPLVGYFDHRDDALAERVSRDLRRRLLADGYGATVRAFARDLSKNLGPREARRLQALVDLAHQYDAEATLRPADFVAHVRHAKVEDGAAARVRVMTVHKAKGLEFDEVVLPELDVKLGPPRHPPMLTLRASALDPPTRVTVYVSGAIAEGWPEAQQMRDELQTRAAIDSLSLLYVALTRAAHGLHLVIAAEKKPSATLPNTSAGVLRGALAPGLAATPGATLFESGTQEWARDRVTRGKQMSLALPPSIQLRKGAAATKTTPSTLEASADAASLLADRDAGARRRGRTVHARLERIGFLEDGANVDQTIAALIAKDEIAALLSRARYELKCPKNGSIELLREVPFAMTEEGALVSGVFDRVVVVRDRDRAIFAEVIDFKSDVVTDARGVAIRAEVHAPQMRAYAAAAARLFDLAVTDVAATLVFLHPGRVVSVP